ncbi:MAG TPA: NADH-quinone oxidoreductase subunit L [Dinghuibacter sp.]|jgi:NADH-quinone oxidoreductase subunit L|uniref:NADH-quinone oxidoreductase subunit L n=1 Tax=Dinghuibacter sp. TaxID=2024697 RepID=UPI002B994E92|nr:NADH-quinone oxidoreductase subunit L [Dinghuibacter sp.]HTJ11053.1 NADH-quinone oxidoreductase subunit L [Dinghuibacter sp.]
MSQLVYLVPLFPLVGFLVIGLGRNLWSKTLTGLIGCATVLASFVVSVMIFNEVRTPGFTPVTVKLFDFIHFGTLNINFAFQVDQLSSLFLLIITGVGSLIHIYSTSYMHEEKPHHFARYFCYLNLFVFSMLLLVLGANYVIMFIGWEGVGLCSYLLIGFWFTNGDYNYAARKAFIMNRIGDLAFLIGIFWILAQFGSVNYQDVFSRAQGGVTTSVVTGITLLLFIGATGKSAQIPLYTWLPDAMAGPTPVSALIHAATMVTAGIYMIARSNVLYTLAPATEGVIAVIGLCTAILAASIAIQQNDIKKVLAYSTVSQLGYMFLGLGVGAYTGAVFHVMTHAFFKALLFLGAGSVIHAMGGEQDIRKMGGLRKFMPVTWITFLIGTIAIAGIPPFSGFFSKDEILSHAYAHNPVLYIIGLFGALMTAFYMFRLLAMTFLGQFRGTHEQEHHLHESPAAITIPLIVLAVLAAGAGFLGIPAYMHPDAHILEKFLAPVFAASTDMKPLAETPAGVEWALTGASVVLILICSAWALAKFAKFTGPGKEATGFAKILENKWYVDELYDAVIVRPINGLAGFLNKYVERLGLDGIVNGIGRLVQYSGRQIRLLQSGQAGTYILLMVIGMVVLFIVQLFI